MLKPLSLSVSLAVALGAAGVSLAGGHKSYATEQSVPSAQSVVPSAQSIADGCGESWGPVAKKCSFFDKFKPKPHEYTYEWVLKKKKVHKPFSLFGHKKTAACGTPACDSCGTTVPSAQSYGSPQVLGSSQVWGAGQTMGTTQIPASYSAPQGGDMAPAAPAPPAEAPAVPEAPSIPPVPGTASTGGLQLLPAGY